MKKSTQYKPNLAFGLLLQGAPKTGKTSLLLSIPGLYIADCDNNLSGALRYHQKATGKTPDFFYDTINVCEEPNEDDIALGIAAGAVPLEKCWERLVACCKRAAAMPEVKVIAVDSAGAVNQYLQAHIVSKKSSDKERYMTISDWIPYKNMFTKFITTFRSVNKMFIMTAHEEPDKAPGEIILKYKPAIDGALKNNLSGFFSDYWHTTAEKVVVNGQEVFQYAVECMPQAQRDLGNSLGLPEKFIFTWSGFEKKLNEYVAQDPATLPHPLGNVAGAMQTLAAARIA